MREIKRLIENKYSFSNLSKKKIFNLYKLKKKFCLKKLKFKKKKNIDFDYNNIDTEKYLFFLLNKNKLNNLDNEILNKIYIKFNTHLKLKKKYNKNLRKISNQEANYKSYLYLGNLLKYVKRVNKLHKLNTILKINDLLFVHLDKLKPKNKVFLSNLIKYEIYLIKNFL